MSGVVIELGYGAECLFILYFWRVRVGLRVLGRKCCLLIQLRADRGVALRYFRT